MVRKVIFSLWNEVKKLGSRIDIVPVHRIQLFSRQLFFKVAKETSNVSEQRIISVSISDCIKHFLVFQNRNGVDRSKVFSSQQGISNNIELSLLVDYPDWEFAEEFVPTSFFAWEFSVRSPSEQRKVIGEGRYLHTKQVMSPFLLSVDRSK